MGRRKTSEFRKGFIAITIICEMDLPPNIPKTRKESRIFPTNDREYYYIMKVSKAVLSQVVDNPLVSLRAVHVARPLSCKDLNTSPRNGGLFVSSFFKTLLGQECPESNTPMEVIGRLSRLQHWNTSVHSYYPLPIYLAT